MGILEVEIGILSFRVIEVSLAGSCGQVEIKEFRDLRIRGLGIRRPRKWESRIGNFGIRADWGFRILG